MYIKVNNTEKNPPKHKENKFSCRTLYIDNPKKTAKTPKAYVVVDFNLLKIFIFNKHL